MMTLSAIAAARRAVERRRQLAVWAMESEPEVLLEPGHGPSTPLDPSTSTDLRSEAIWRGTVVSRGFAQGTVRIARHPAEGLHLASGEVLAAPSTDPAWTPLFLKTGALIMETGGYLSHGAIVAREFGIPAVVNLPGMAA